MELELLVKRAKVSLRPVREVNARLAAWYFGYVESDENRRKHHPKVPKLGLLFTVSRIFRSKADLYVGSLNDVSVSFPEERWFGGEIPARDIEQRGQLIEAFFLWIWTAKAKWRGDTSPEAANSGLSRRAEARG
jgi:hypothetical protein